MSTLLQDLRFGLRMLARNPGFSAVAVLTLALGIGANASIFSFIDAALLKPPRVKDPDRLVALYRVELKSSSPGYSSFSYPDYIDFRDRNQVFSGLAARSPISVDLGTRGEPPERVTAEMVSENYFSVLGLSLAPGRSFLPEEGRTPGTHPVVIISHALWQRLFGADPSLTEKTLTLNGHNFNVVGVAPAGFRGTDLSSSADIWVPLMMHDVVAPLFASSGFNILGSRTSDNFDPIGRLNPGISLLQAEAAMKTLAHQQADAFPDSSHKGWSVTVLPINEAKVSPWSRGSVVRLAGLLMAAAGLVLLIVCANLANLLLARAAARRKEIGIRLALGTSRIRLLRLMLTESVLLSLLGGSAGLLVAVWTTSLLSTFKLPGIDPQALEIALDTRVFFFTLVLSLVTAMVFGLIPALRASHIDPLSVLKDLGVVRGRGSTKSNLQNLMVISQVALCLVLLVSTGLILRTFHNLQNIKLGFDTSSVVLVALDLTNRGYSQSEARSFYARLLERVESLPGMRSVSLAENVPLGSRRLALGAVIQGRQPPSDLPAIPIEFNAVTPAYFQTLGIPLLRGRDFTDQDRDGSPGVAIVNETMAHRFWPGEDPIGKTFSLWRPKGEFPLMEVIGVVKDGRYQRNWRADPSPFMFIPLSQEPYFALLATLHLRSDLDLASTVAAIRREVQGLDKNLPLRDIRTMKTQASSALSVERMRATLLGIYGLVALVLAAVGVYGLMSYLVAQRTHEIGVRMALGAQRTDMLRLIVSHGLRLTFVGVGVGLVATLALTRLLRAFLFGVAPTDPVTFAGVSLLLAGVALLATYIPARRATKVDPMVALRYE